MHAGDLRASVRHVGTPAHTTNDSIVWIPRHSMLFCGDLIFWLTTSRRHVSGA